MTHPEGPFAPGTQPAVGGGAASTRVPGLALGLGIAAVIAPIFVGLFVPVVGVLGLGGVIAVVLALRARGTTQGRVRAWALALGAIGALVDIVLVVVMLFVLGAAGPTHYRIETQGGPSYAVTYSVGSGPTSDVWSEDWWREGTTDATSIEITLTPPADTDEQQPLRCRIIWDGAVVAEESAQTGPVTCRYEE
jgi:hypothetical protein